MKILFLIVMAALGAAAQQPAERKDIRELIELSGGLAALDQLFTGDALETQLRAMVANAPADKRAQAERFATEFSKEFLVEARGQREQLIALVAGIYAKYYTPEDIKSLIEFYKTPIGRKLAATAPKTAIESMQAGQQWGQQLGSKVGARVGQRLEAEQKEKK